MGSSVLSRYLLRQFVGWFVPIMVGFIFLYLIVDLFGRMDILLKHHATIGASARYFLFKIPLMITQITPAAAIAALLLTFGGLARSNEITALRACGVSLPQTAVPLLAVCLLISVAVLVWNETVVPYATHQFQVINNVEIRNRGFRGILNDREIWYRGKGGFYNIDHVDKNTQTIFGLVVYRIDDRFQLSQVVEIARAHWLEDRWELTGVVEREMTGNGGRPSTGTASEVSLPEAFDDFVAIQREPEELSFLRLRAWIDGLRQKGIDASQYLVDLHLKVAVPFATVVLALVAIPIGGRVRRHPSMAAIVALGMTVGFAYWVVLALANSLGQSAVIPPVLAAWVANLLFALAGVTLFLYSE